MNRGFNTNIIWKGSGLHVQTEKKDKNGQIIETLVYREGYIIFSTRNPYHEDDDQVLDLLIENQHKRVCYLIKNGLLEQLLAGNIGKTDSETEQIKTEEKKSPSPDISGLSLRIEDNQLSTNEHDDIGSIEQLIPSEEAASEFIKKLEEKYISGSFLKKASLSEKNTALIARIKKYLKDDKEDEQSSWKKLVAVLRQMMSLMNHVIVAAIVTENGLPLAIEHGSDLIIPTKELTTLFKRIMNFSAQCTSSSLDFGRFEELHGYTGNISFITKNVTEKIFLIVFTTKQANLGKIKAVLTQYSLMLKIIFD